MDDEAPRQAPAGALLARLCADLQGASDPEAVLEALRRAALGTVAAGDQTDAAIEAAVDQLQTALGRFGELFRDMLNRSSPAAQAKRLADLEADLDRIVGNFLPDTE